MKAEELQVGDWVFDSNKESHLITAVNKINGEYLIDNKIPIPFVYIEPIPITPEILEKNGFTLEYDGYILKFNTSDQDYLLVQFRHNGEVRCVEGEITNKYGFNTRTILYVHQLQHQMKLMGIEKKIIVE